MWWTAALGVLKWVAGINVGDVVKDVTGTVQANIAAKQNTAIAQIGADKDVSIVRTQADAAALAENIRADTRTSELQAQLAGLDRTDWRTAWMRPYGFAVAIWYFTAFVLEHTVPRFAKWIGVEVRALEWPWDYVVLAILGAVFVFRPIEKGATANARATVVAAHIEKGKGK